MSRLEVNQLVTQRVWDLFHSPPPHVQIRSFCPEASRISKHDRPEKPKGFESWRYFPFPLKRAKENFWVPSHTTLLTTPTYLRLNADGRALTFQHVQEYLEACDNHVVANGDEPIRDRLWVQSIVIEVYSEDTWHEPPWQPVAQERRHSLDQCPDSLYHRQPFYLLEFHGASMQILGNSGLEGQNRVPIILSNVKFCRTKHFGPKKQMDNTTTLRPYDVNRISEKIECQSWDQSTLESLFSPLTEPGLLRRIKRKGDREDYWKFRAET